MSELHKFIFEGLPVRGMLVRLTDSWREVLALKRAARFTGSPMTVAAKGCLRRVWLVGCAALRLTPMACMATT